MILPLVGLLLQTAPMPAASPRPEQKPVRVWLASNAPLRRGDPVRVYVQLSTDGYLVVLHRRTDGRIEVLFPGNPTDDPSVGAGTYEIRGAGAGPAGAGDRGAFVVAEPDGTGLILAALAPGSYRFDEFVRAASWEPDALTPSWSGADGESALADIVQRMLGDGYFNYDVVTYTVAPRSYAMQDSVAPPPYPVYPSCVNCSFVGFQEIIFEPFSLCDSFFASCFGAPSRRHERLSDFGAPDFNPPMNVMALSLGPPPQLASAATPQVAPHAPRYAAKPPTVAGPPIAPRARAPAPGGPSRDGATVAVRAVPLGPGHMDMGGRPAGAAPAAARRAVASRAAPASFRDVRVTLSPAAPAVPAAPPVPAEEPRPVAGVRARAGLAAVPREAFAPPVEHAVAAAMPRPWVTAVMPPAQALAQPRSRAVAGAGATGQMHGMALPGAGWRAPEAAASGGTRRR